jgi:hypothetical protein
MGLGILQRYFQTQTRGIYPASIVTEQVLQACIGEKISIVTDLYFDQILMPDVGANTTAYFNPPSDLSGTYYNANLIYFESDFLSGCQVGDILKNDAVAGNPNPNMTFTLLEKINGNLGRFNATFVQHQSGTIGGEFLVNITPLKSAIFQYGINESGDYTSQTDGSLQKFSIDSATALTNIVSQNMLPSGNPDWNIDVVMCQGQGADGNFPSTSHVRIRLVHNVVVTPFFLVGQLDDLKAGIAPDYFKADNSLGYKAQIDWNENNTYLDPSKRIVLDTVGRFGWFNKRFDGVASDYSITSLTLQRVSDSAFVNQLEYDEIEVKLNIHSAAGSFTAVDSRLVFGFNYLPQDKSLYQNTGRSLEKNFGFESKLLVPNNVAVNGDNFGTNDQIIKTIKGQVLSATDCQVTVRILFGSNRVDILTQEDVANYAMWVICENTSFDTQVCDKTNLLIQVDEIHVQLTTVDLIDDNTEFIEHPYNVPGAGFPTLEMFPVDDVVASSLMSIDYTGLESDGILLKSCKCQLVLTHATEADIVLDSFIIGLENYPVIGSLPGVQAINFNQKRPFKVEDGIRNTVSFGRNYGFDSATKKFFTCSFPFMNRWEYWIQLLGVSSFPAAMFDNTLDFNGLNNFWNRLVNTAGWTLKYRKTFLIIQNGQTFEQELENDLTSVNFNANTEWNNCSIKTYDLDTNDEIVIGPKKYAYSAKDTKVIATFDKTVGTIPDISNIAIVIWGESFEGGGISEITRISSVYNVNSASIFKSVDTTNKVKVTNVGSVFTGEAIIDGSKIQNLSKLTLYARIYYPYDPIDDLGRVTNDFILRETNDGQIRIV